MEKKYELKRFNDYLKSLGKRNLGYLSQEDKDEKTTSGTECSELFEAFANDAAKGIPFAFAKVKKPKWMGGMILYDYFWMTLKKAEWERSPLSISLFIRKADYNALIVMVETKDAEEGRKSASCWTAEQKRKAQAKMLDCDYLLKDNMKFIVKDEESIYYSGRDKIEAKKAFDENDKSKLQVEIRIEDVEEKDNNGTILDETIEAIKNLLPFYVKAMNAVQANNDTSIEKEETPKMSQDLNIILYGPPGTGKTYNTISLAVELCEPDLSIEGWSYEAIWKEYKKLKESGRIAFTTFHQSYGYEEFIEGIKPYLKKDDASKTGEGGDSLRYKIEPGVFKKFCEKAKSKRAENYVFIIDEINRGNISKIFGELITLIEDTKREGESADMGEAMEAVLPYSGESFSVPRNVYILGTMNTADRSIALMDTALRRRFTFIEMMPKPSLLKDIEITEGKKTLEVMKMLETINERIEFLYDREHTIGHAFFMKLMKLKEKPALELLGNIFKTKIIPLLQEYFYEDYAKIQLVLGDNVKEMSNKYKFVTDDEKDPDKVFSGAAGDLETRTIFTINEEAFGRIESYIKIYEPLNKDDEKRKEDSKGI